MITRFTVFSECIVIHVQINMNCASSRQILSVPNVGYSLLTSYWDIRPVIYLTSRYGTFDCTSRNTNVGLGLSMVCRLDLEVS